MRFSPFVDALSALSPLFRVERSLHGHQVVANPKGPTSETMFPAQVSIRQADAGEHIPPIEKKKPQQVNKTSA